MTIYNGIFRDDSNIATFYVDAQGNPVDINNILFAINIESISYTNRWNVNFDGFNGINHQNIVDFFTNIDSVTGLDNPLYDETINTPTYLDDSNFDIRFNKISNDTTYSVTIVDTSGYKLEFSFITSMGVFGVPKATITAATFTYKNLACFKKNTLILTPAGYSQVENLRCGDYVLSSKNIPIKIIQIASFISSGKEKDLYILEKSSIKENIPFMDLYMSNNHAYKSNDKWHHMWCSSSSAKMVKSDDDDVIEYYHIIIDDYFSHNLVANGVEVESCYVENRNIKKIEWVCNKNECDLKILPELKQNRLFTKISNKKIILA